MFAFPNVRFAVIAAVAALAACAGQSTAPPVATPLAPQLTAAAVTIGVSPAKLNFTTNPSMKMTVSEAKYTGTFTLTMNPSGIVKLSKSKVKGPKATVTVTAQNAGKTTITVADSKGTKKAVPVTVTQGVIIIQ